MGEYLEVVKVVGIYGFGALVWWRLRSLELEVMRLRDFKHDIGSLIGNLRGTLETLIELYPNRRR